jgi:hypothetical protein
MQRFLLILSLALQACLAAEDYDLDIAFREDRLPDFCLAPFPIEISNSQAVGFMLQFGRQTFRSNATYGFETCWGPLIKISGEYLTQKLGFSFESGRSHRWVAQGSGGAACFFPLPFARWDNLEFKMRFSSAASRRFRERGYDGQLIRWGIAGSHSIGLSALACAQFWPSGTLSPKLLYDWVIFRRHLEERKKENGWGIGITLDQTIGCFLTLQAGVELHRPYIFYHASLSSSSPLGFNMALFAEKVHGLHGIPSSSRIGLQLGFAFGRLNYHACLEDALRNPSSVACWVSEPAVYMPQVLVMKDQKLEDVPTIIPQVIARIGTVLVNPGLFQFDVSPYFSQSMTLIFGASGLPPGFQINPRTGVISGMADGSFTGSFEAAVFAVNSNGRASQTFTLVFP